MVTEDPVGSRVSTTNSEDCGFRLNEIRHKVMKVSKLQEHTYSKVLEIS